MEQGGWELGVGGRGGGIGYWGGEGEWIGREGRGG